MLICRFAALIFLSLYLGACASANVVSEPMPTGVTAGEPKVDPVPIYKSGDAVPTKALIPFARIGAHGNGYATQAYLEKAIAKKAAQLGADCAWIETAQLNNGGTVTSYGNGIALSQPVQFLSVYGFACAWAPIRLGITMDKEGKIMDVVPGSAAERAGVHIGDRLLAIGGFRLSGDPLALYKAEAGARAGQPLPAEFVAPDNSVKKITLIGDANN